MRKILFLMIFAVLLTGCRGTSVQNPSEENSLQDSELVNSLANVQYKDVVFMNRDIRESVEAVERTKNELRNYPEGLEDTLYAFYASSGAVDAEIQTGDMSVKELVARDVAKSEETVKRALELGLMVMPEHSYCRYQNESLETAWEKHFAGNSELYPLLGDCVIVGTLEQITELFCETEPIDGYTWFVSPAVRPDWIDIIDVKTEEFEEAIGNDVQVKLKVPVIMPNKTVN